MRCIPFLAFFGCDPPRRKKYNAQENVRDRRDFLIQWHFQLTHRKKLATRIQKRRDMEAASKIPKTDLGEVLGYAYR
eukprot:1094930-Amorphochlora_amoeboformis.AAC.1